MLIKMVAGFILLLYFNETETKMQRPKSIVIQLKCLDLAKERTEGGPARGRAFVCLDSLHCSELQILEQV